jgi:hypothetical protein
MPGERARQLGRPFHALACESEEEAVGIRLRPKSSRAWEGVGWGHSTVDSRDNTTLEEGRIPAVSVLDGGKDRRIGRAKKRRKTSSGPSEETRCEGAEFAALSSHRKAV